MTEQSQGTNGKGTATQENNTLSVTDNRTGKSYDIEITDGTVRAMDLRQIKTDEDDFGLMTYDPGFTNTASARSAITYIDGEKGILQHRGIPIEELCEKSSYLEVAYLLVNGHLPNEAELADWVYQITHHTYVHESIKNFMNGFRHDAHPMGMLLASVGALSTFYPEAKDIDDEWQQHVTAIRLIAKMPTLAAFAYRHSLGLPYVYPDNDLSYAGNLLSMLFKMAEPKYEPDPRLEKALDVSCSSCTPTTSRTAPRRRSAWWALRGWTRTRRSRPVWRGSTDRCTAARTWTCSRCSRGSRRSRTSRTSCRA